VAIGCDHDVRILREEQLEIGCDEIRQVSREQQRTRGSRACRLEQRRNGRVVRAGRFDVK